MRNSGRPFTRMHEPRFCIMVGKRAFASKVGPETVWSISALWGDIIGKTKIEAPEMTKQPSTAATQSWPRKPQSFKVRVVYK